MMTKQSTEMLLNRAQRTYRMNHSINNSKLESLPSLNVGGDSGSRNMNNFDFNVSNSSILRTDRNIGTSRISVPSDYH